MPYAHLSLRLTLLRSLDRDSRLDLGNMVCLTFHVKVSLDLLLLGRQYIVFPACKSVRISTCMHTRARACEIVCGCVLVCECGCACVQVCGNMGLVCIFVT